MADIAAQTAAQLSFDQVLAATGDEERHRDRPRRRPARSPAVTLPAMTNPLMQKNISTPNYSVSSTKAICQDGEAGQARIVHVEHEHGECEYTQRVMHGTVEPKPLRRDL